ncbi:hypothetical protein RSO68_11495 [Halomonas saccharevitans]|uniref:Uncharacterized protein n=1 Tax=Halomonas saccharevitans TaxID=416872 RepID=A0ABU3NG10_9GAMM|nr:hypothetical protein [Halomonas saccharevitans]MDT8880101.1 hypothetical protein [Halomonas saccharevitans]
MALEKSCCTTRVAILVSAISSFVITLGWLSLFVYFGPNPFSDFSFSGYFPLSYASEIDRPATYSFLSQLMGSERDSNIQELWGFQSGLYQTIITFLIAINGLIAAISVIYIKSTSEEKAEDITKKYIASDYFDVLLSRKLSSLSESTFQEAQKDFESSAEKIYGALDALERLEKENGELKQQLRVVSEKVAKLDDGDSEGKSFSLTKGAK